MVILLATELEADNRFSTDLVPPLPAEDRGVLEPRGL